MFETSGRKPWIGVLYPVGRNVLPMNDARLRSIVSYCSHDVSTARAYTPYEPRITVSGLIAYVKPSRGWNTVAPIELPFVNARFAGR